MIDFEQTTRDDEALYRLVLVSYRDQEAEAEKAHNPEFDGWLPRVRTVPGIDDVRLSQIHGQLIAQGLLKFQLTGRKAGVQYRLSSLGRHAISQHGAESASVPPHSHDDSHDELGSSGTSSACFNG